MFHVPSTLRLSLLTISDVEIGNFTLEYFKVQRCTVIRTSRYTLQFDIRANVLEIRALQSPKCIVRFAVDCTIFLIYDIDKKKFAMLCHGMVLT
jgi:hypothetical protein